MTRPWNVAGIVAFVAVPLLVGCGGGGGGGSSSCSKCDNVAGTWNTSEYVDNTACDGSTYTDYRTYLVTQSGCSLTVVPEGSGLSMSGKICGSTLSWSGSYPESGGTSHITSMTMNLEGTTTFSGTAHWTWSGSGSSCSGSTEVTATKE
jgi:hypothetical protein